MCGTGDTGNSRKWNLASQEISVCMKQELFRIGLQVQAGEQAEEGDFCENGGRRYREKNQYFTQDLKNHTRYYDPADGTVRCLSGSAEYDIHPV